MKKIRFCFFLLVFAMFVTACGRKETAVGETVVYHLNKEGTAIASEDCKVTGDSPETQIEELLAKLEEVPESVDLKRTIPENVKLLNYTLDRKQLYLDFSTEYLNMNKATEVLVRAAIVKTMVQVEEVSFIGIRIAGEPLKDSRGNNIGLMNENTFLDNIASGDSATKIINLNLYFANKAGDKLKNQSCVVEYNANMAVEKVIVEMLIQGPTEKGCYATIPKDTKLMNVTTKDGVCYVNLDTGFTAQGYDVLGTVTIYSIVNSLTELPDIKAVQILVNGETSMNYKDNISLETIFQRNMELVEKGD